MFYKTEAVIIKSINLKEADKFLTVYTSKFGKINAVAKGVRKTKSKFGSSMEFLTHSKLLLYKKYNNDVYLVTQNEIINSFYEIRKNLGKFSAAAYVAELIDKFVEPNESNDELWVLMLKTLSFFREEAKKEYMELLLRFFEIRLITILGFKISLESCSSCGAKVVLHNEKDKVGFDSISGGILCNSCAKKRSAQLFITRESAVFMREMQTVRFNDILKFSFSKELLKELQDILFSILVLYTDKKINSLSFMKKIVIS